MAFGKTFVFSLITLIGVTFGGWILYLALSGGISNFVTEIGSLSGIASAFFFPDPTVPYPGQVISALVSQFFITPLDFAGIFKYVFYIIAPLLGAVVAGLVGKSKAEVFGAWLLAIGVCFGVALTLVLIDVGLTVASIINMILGTIVSAFLYGCVALLVSNSESF